jgi:hypothetical protein
MSVVSATVFWLGSSSAQMARTSSFDLLLDRFFQPLDQGRLQAVGREAALGQLLPQRAFTLMVEIGVLVLDARITDTFISPL